MKRGWHFFHDSEIRPRRRRRPRRPSSPPSPPPPPSPPSPPSPPALAALHGLLGRKRVGKYTHLSSERSPVLSTSVAPMKTSVTQISHRCLGPRNVFVLYDPLRHHGRHGGMSFRSVTGFEVPVPTLLDRLRQLDRVSISGSNVKVSPQPPPLSWADWMYTWCPAPDTLGHFGSLFAGLCKLRRVAKKSY